MFTGLIESVGTVTRIDKVSGAARLTLDAAFDGDPVQPGDSIAVNGVCLTVTRNESRCFTFDVSPETWNLTTFRRMRGGARVNLERALRVSGRLGGHIVSGHVDCLATITDRREKSGNIVFTFRLPVENARHVVAKGSIALDGASLTVNSAERDTFNVNIIPHTAAVTVLRDWKPGDEVNVETDILAKYMERLLLDRRPDAPGGVTMDILTRNGFA